MNDAYMQLESSSHMSFTYEPKVLGCIYNGKEHSSNRGGSK